MSNAPLEVAVIHHPNTFWLDQFDFIHFDTSRKQIQLNDAGDHWFGTVNEKGEMAGAGERIERNRLYDTFMENQEMSGITRCYRIEEFDSGTREFEGEGLYLRGKPHGLHKWKYNNGNDFSYSYYLNGNDISSEKCTIDSTLWSSKFGRDFNHLVQGCFNIASSITVNLAMIAELDLIVTEAIVVNVVISEQSLRFVRNVVFENMPRLQSLVFLSSSCGNSESGGVLSIMHCPKLTLLVIKEYCFIHYHGLVLFSNSFLLIINRSPTTITGGNRRYFLRNRTNSSYEWLFL